MLMVDLRTALHHAIKENIAVRRENVPLKNDGASRSVHVEVTPLRGEGSGERLFFVTFRDASSAVQEESVVETKGRAKNGQPPMRKLEMERLHEELSSTKESLQAIIQEREAANEELKSANEEIQSSNEELQSTNEELETAKEELQSANEELTTVNEEMANRNAELATLNNDLNNLLSSINIPIIIVDNDLCIRRVTSPGERVFNLIPSDVGRPLSNIKPNIEVPDLAPLIREVIDTLSIREREVSDSNGRWHQLRIRPYRTADNKIDGAVITLVEIDQMKRNIAELHSVVDFAHAILDSARDPGLVLDDDLRIKQTNEAFRDRFKIARADLENARIQKIGDHWKMPKLGPWLHELVGKKRRSAELNLVHRFPILGSMRLHFRAQRLESNGHHLIVLTITEPAPPAQTK
jgi:two-component system CheB/CheR fusion protein